MTIAWHEILERLQTNASLQLSHQDLYTGYALYKSLNEYVQAMRFSFLDTEAKSKALTGCEEYQQLVARKRKRNSKWDHLSGSTKLDEVVESQTPRQHFEIQVFIVIIDNVLSKLAKRMEAYHKVTRVSGMLRSLKSLPAEETLKRSPISVSAYPDDVETRDG